MTRRAWLNLKGLHQGAQEGQFDREAWLGILREFRRRHVVGRGEE